MKTLLTALALITSFFSFSQDYRLYGLTGYGGAFDRGAMYEYDISSGTTSKLWDFEFTFGDYTYGELIHASNNKFYGLTYSGGADNHGTLFEYDWSSGYYDIVYSFYLPTSGAGPLSEVIEGEPGVLYGTTSNGGNNGGGCLFKYDIASDQLTVLHHFEDVDGESNHTLFLASDGLIYGSNRRGGTNNHGKLFSYNPQTQTFTNLHHFDQTDGRYPYSQMIEVGNGVLYGTTSEGGATNHGVVFSYDIGTDTYQKVADFDSLATGRWPIGGLVHGGNNKLYGVSNGGGTDDEGVLYELDLGTSALTGKIDLEDLTHGKWPWAEMIEVEPGVLYGVMNSGGFNHEGVLFEYVVATNTYTKKLEFDYDVTGRWPYGAPMLADYETIVAVSENNDNALSVFPTLTQGVLFIHSEHMLSDVELRVVGPSGKVAKSVSWKELEGKTQIDLYELEQGSYLVEILHAGGKNVERIVVTE